MGKFSGLSAHWMGGGTIHRFLPGRGGSLWWIWDMVLELMEGGGKIFGHGDITGMLVIIPVERESALEVTVPVH